MMSLFRRSESSFVKSLFEKMPKLKSQDFQKRKIVEKFDRLEDIFISVMQDELPLVESIDLVQAFIDGNACKVLARFVQMELAGQLNMDSSDGHLSLCYRRFLSAWGNAMCVPDSDAKQDVCDHYLASGVKATLDQFLSTTFLAKCQEPTEASNTTRAINQHFALLLNTAAISASQLGERLRDLEFYSVLRPYALAKYALSGFTPPLSIHEYTTSFQALFYLDFTGID